MGLAHKEESRASARWSAILGIIIAVAALMVRLPQLDAFVTPDELKWVCRSITFYRGLQDGDLANTLTSGHPGVITMWLGVPSMGVDLSQEWLSACQNPSISSLVEHEGLERLQDLGQYLFKARRSVVWFTAIMLGLSVYLMARLFGLRVAALAGVLMAIDPFLLAHSRFLHLDAVTTSLLLLSVLLLMCARRSHSWVWWALSGVAGALAMLNKSPAMFVAPFVGLVLVYDWLVEKEPLWDQVRRLLIWGGAALVSYLVFWPAMWVQPAATLKLVFDTAFFYASNPHTNSNYFWGSPRPDPGVFFYPIALAFRLTPLSSVGALLGLPWLVRKSSRRTELWIAAAFVLLYGAFMTVGQKKFDRYLLPVHPFVQLIVAVGLWGAIDWLVGRVRAQSRRLASAVLTALLAVAIGATSAGVLAHAPYYLTYYNPLLGGIAKAREILLVGWGEGLDQAAAYLEALPDDRDKTVCVRALPDFAPFYSHLALDESYYDPANVSYVVQYINEIQRELDPDMMARYYDTARPEHIVQIDGVDYVWVYKNRTAEPVIALIEEQAQPGDVILISRPSLFGEEYAGDLPVYEVDQQISDDELLAQLEAIRSSARRIWYVEYWEKNPNGRTTWVRNLLSTHGKETLDASYTDIEVRLLELCDEVSFTDLGETMPADLQFGPELALQSYRLTPTVGRYGSGVGLELDWLVTRQVGHYYSLYVHVLDDQGHRWGLGDTWLQDAIERPAVSWELGSAITVRMSVDLAPGIMPGRYRMIVGLRDRLGDDNPEITSTSGESLGNEAELGELVVVASPWNAADEIAPEKTLAAPLSDGLLLLGSGELPASLYPGDELDLELYWQAQGDERPDYAVRLALLDEEGGVMATGQTAVGSATYPTSAWATDEVLWDYYQLQIPDDAAYASATLQAQLVDAADEPQGSAVSLGQIEVLGRLSERPAVSIEQAAQLGEAINLLGYDLVDEVEAGGVLDLTLYWEAAGHPATGYTVFTHLLDADGVLKGQLDSVPMAGHRPTDTWEQGEYIVDHYAIPVDAELASGDYTLAVGMYDAAADYARVPLYVDGERQADDRLVLSRTVAITTPTQ